MCEPTIMTTMGVIGTGLSAASSLMGGISAYQQGKAQAEVAGNNADLVNAQIEREAELGEKERGRQSMRNAQLKGQQIARGSAAGFDVWAKDSSMQDILGDTAYYGTADIAEMFNANAYRLNDLENQRLEYKNQATAYKDAGKGALLGGMLGGAAALGSGISDTYRGWAKTNMALEPKDLKSRGAHGFKDSWLTYKNRKG